MKIEITPHHYLQLAKKAYSIDMVYILTLMSQDYDIKPLFDGSKRIENVVTGLMRKDLINENGITVTGKELLKFITTEDGTMLPKKKKEALGPFDDWWEAYPGTDTFRYKGRTFKGSRNLRGDKKLARIRWDKLINEGEYSPKTIIAAMLFDVNQKKEMSVKQNKNKLTFLQNSATYIYQRTFEPFIELLKSDLGDNKSTIAKEIDI